MTRESGQHKRLRFGSVSADVSLVKASTKPREAQHETRRVLAEPEPVRGTVDLDDPANRSIAAQVGAPVTTDPFGDPVAAPVTDAEASILRAAADAAVAPLPPGLLGPMGDPTFDVPDPAEPWDGTNPPPRDADRPEQPEPDKVGGVPPSEPADEPEPSRGPVQAWPDGDASRAEPIDVGVARRRDEIAAVRAAESAPAPTYVPPATRVEQGVHLDNGTWVDLTAKLAEVDERTKVDGLEVVRTIPASSYASERVRELFYLAGVNADEYKVLALLWRALRYESKAAEVRWTKRTAQASGIILARGELGSRTNPAHLALLELEWPANVRKPSARVVGPVGADVRADEVAAAVDLVVSFAAPAPRVELRDERLAKRAELLELARAGRLDEYVPPAEPMPEDLGDEAGGLAEALSLAAAWNRDHAPA